MGRAGDLFSAVPPARAHSGRNTTTGPAFDLFPFLTLLARPSVVPRPRNAKTGNYRNKKISKNHRLINFVSETAPVLAL